MKNRGQNIYCICAFHFRQLPPDRRKVKGCFSILFERMPPLSTLASISIPKKWSPCCWKATPSYPYTFHPSLVQDISLQSRYLNFYREGNNVCNATYNHYAFEVGYSNVWLRNFRYQIGIAYELYHNPDILYKEENPPFVRNMTDNTVRCFVRVDYNIQGHFLFPKWGMKFMVTGFVYTDNMGQYRGHSLFCTICCKYLRSPFFQ